MDKSRQKRILVMMSTYNGEKHLHEQLDSILNQKTSHEIHLRIRDDGSKDCTIDIIEDYIKRYPSQIELIRGENLGYNGSFFSLIQSANGYDYYSISDQDDVWLPDKLQVACDAIDKVKENIPVLYASTSYLVHDDLVPYGTTRKKNRPMSMNNTIIQNICPGHTQVMNNKMIAQLSKEVDVIRIYVYDSWIQNVANLFGQIIFDNDSHTYYRQYDGNQLGSGVGIWGQLLSSIKRTEKNDGKKYRRQIAYFYELYGQSLNEMTAGKAIKEFLSTDSILSRIRFFFCGKLYRQNIIETFAFKCAVLLGKY